MEKVLIGYNFTEVLETAAIYKAAVFEYNDRNKQCKLREDNSNSSAIYTF